jgi:hypothetical protein
MVRDGVVDAQAGDVRVDRGLDGVADRLQRGHQANPLEPPVRVDVRREHRVLTEPDHAELAESGDAAERVLGLEGLLRQDQRGLTDAPRHRRPAPDAGDLDAVLAQRARPYP